MTRRFEMPTEKNPRKRIYTAAAAVGLALGTMGIAAAATTPSPSQPSDTTTVAPSGAVDVQGTVEAPARETESEAPGDEAVDGIDHQFEGEEVGENGNGIPDPNEAAEVEDSEPEGSEATSGDEAVDGIDHQFEGEEVGENGNGIPDADDAAEAVPNG
jgi:hypothetical protein